LFFFLLIFERIFYLEILMLNLGGKMIVMTRRMPPVETLHHRQEESRFLVGFQQQQPSRGISQNLTKVKII